MAGEELIEIILQAIDNASSVFESVSSSAEEVGNSIDNINGAGMQDASQGADQLEQETNEADQAVQQLDSDLGIINSSMLMQLADQVGAIGDKAEGMAQEMNTAAITVGQLATQTGIAEPQLVSMINHISNATFPNDEAMMYVKSLDQIGVASENLAQSATDLDKINDAFGLGAQTTNSLGQELSVLGVDMNNVSSSFNALAYANSNTVGGMQNYYTFLKKYDSQFNELGYNVDQASVIIAGATQKFGGGRAALSGLSDALKTAGNDSAALEQALGLPAGATQKFGGGKAALSGLNEALKESNGDTRALEQALGLQAGSIENATQLTGQYEGQLQELANEEAEHKTLVDQLGAAWVDVSLSVSGALGPFLSMAGAIGQVGQFGLQVQGLTQLRSALSGTITWIRSFNIAQTAKNLIEGEGAIASAAAAIGITTEAAAAEGATFAFGGLAIAEGAALWPILAIIAAIALFVAAVFEIGKAFGWWTDVGTMFEAIQAGIMRLWDAFINHPDVQALIQGITDAWNWLVPAVTGVVQAVMDFFGINKQGNFDFVRALIDAIGLAWQSMTAPIRLVIGLVQWAISIFNQFATGQMTLQGVLTNIWNTITTTLSGIFTRIITSVLRFGAQMLTNAIRAGRNFVNGIINNIRNLPSRVYSILVGVVSRISSAIHQWVNTASSTVKGVITAITSPFGNVAGAISSALSGVTDALTAPFRAAWEHLEPIVNKIKDAMSIIPGANAAGYELNAAGYDLNAAGGADVTYVNEGTHDTIDVNYNISLDLVNVPSHISTGQLLDVMQDKSFLERFVGSRDFQTIDAKVKSRISARNSRAVGR